MEPPVFSRIGNMNLILAMNLRMTTPMTPIGPSAFLILVPSDSGGAIPRVSTDPEISAIEKTRLNRAPLQVAKCAPERVKYITREQGLLGCAIVEQRQLSRAPTNPCRNPGTVE